MEGNMREIVGKMNLEEMVSDRQKFATLVKENAEPDLAAMGLDIVSFNVQNFVDGNGLSKTSVLTISLRSRKMRLFRERRAKRRLPRHRHRQRRKRTTPK